MDLDRLTNLRKSKRWSIQYTADRLGIAKSTYAGYESGYREPPLEAIKLLADLFETSVDFLLGRMDEQIELTEYDTMHLAVDGKLLSKIEVLQMIAFIRTIREMERTELQNP